MSENAFSLPAEIQSILKRKSSRDPVSRFSNKLHSLLNYAGNDIKKQEYIGAGWLSNTHFRINKKKLVVVMDIKLNTLNVNLKDLKFHQLQGDQNGWTIWERAGFRFESTIDDLMNAEKNDDEAVQLHPFSDDMQNSKLSILKEINLGMMNHVTTQNFKKITTSIWDEFLAMLTSNKNTIDKSEFLDAAAKRFRASHQKLSNSKLVLETIFTCYNTDNFSVVDFAKLLAKFGPEATLMEKIASLLKSSNTYQDWLKIVQDPSQLSYYNNVDIFGYFDYNEHNCFIIKRINQPVRKIYNIVDQPATGDYLIDSNGVKYNSWQDYFEKNQLC